MKPKTSPAVSSPARPVRPGPSWGRMFPCLLDAALLAIGFGLNFWVWLGFIRLGHIPNEYIQLFACMVGPVVLLRLVFLWAGGLYRSLGSHLGFHELTIIGIADTAATAGLIGFNVLSSSIPSLGSYYPLDSSGAHILRLPWGIVINDWMVSLIALGGIRFLRRQYETYLLKSETALSRRTLIVGTGDVAASVARDLATETRGRFVPVALIDPEGTSVGRTVHGLRVMGDVDSIERIAEETGAEEIVIALDHPAPQVIAGIVRRLPPGPKGLKIVPPLDALMSGGVEVSALRPVQIEDLLGRSVVSLQDRKGHEALQGKRVLVTGAGGSIGSELVRQALMSGALELMLLEISENNLFELLESVGPLAKARGVQLTPYVGDASDPDAVDRLFSERRPDVIFHAAAHKHVHLMQAQPAEAVRNNVGGVVCIAQAALRYRSGRLVFVSTDKAVNPVGVMGQTKRAGELIIAALAAKTGCDFVSVRFGNVLGSRGSVLPTFRHQIERGGPVTVTDPRASRYFMTVDEAVALLIEAGTAGKAGSVLILNMGKPVNIDELARNVIRLSGFEPERDIAIEYTGLRPGERLDEALAAGEVMPDSNSNGNVLLAREDAPSWEALKPAIDELLEAALAREDARAKALLEKLMRTFDRRSGEPEEAKPVRRAGSETKPKSLSA